MDADGSRIAFIRLPSVLRQGGAGAYREELTPWSIRVAEVSSGTGREVWHADKGSGSVWGPSYGGLLTALALARSSDLFAAGVDMMGVHDWSVLGGSVATPALDPEKQREQVRLAFDSSPMASMTTWKSPVLLIHGDDDRNVAFNQTVRLIEALRQRGVDFEEIVFPDEVHDFLLFKHWIVSIQAGDQFFDRKLSH
ncbi:MAG TPA: prolyl oligopeptidase family serine peptidase [Bryobacteraceae bacterium]